MSILKSKVVKNGIWLYILLFVNTVLPLLTIPYVTRVLGAEQYGMYSIALNWIMYLTTIINYGFDLTGTKYIAEEGKENPFKLEKYVTSVILAKLMLAVISGALMLVIILIFDYNYMQSVCVIILFLGTLGEVIKQTWLFQGLQVMQNITIISVVARILSTLLILGFVGENSLFLYCAIHSSTGIFIGVVGVIIVRYKLKIRFVKVSFADVILRLKEGFILFTTSVASKIFSGLGITILGIVSNAYIVGIYSAIYKIPTILISCFSPISQALYPHICIKYKENYFSGRKMTRKIAFIVTGIFTVGSIMLIVLRNTVIQIAFGSEYIIEADLLIPFMIWLCLSIYNCFLGTNTLIASGHSKEYSKAFVIGTITLVLCNIIFGLMWKMYGIAWAQVISELGLMICNMYYVKKLEMKNK